MADLCEEFELHRNQIPTSVHPRKLEEAVAAITRSPAVAAPSTLADAAMRDSLMSSGVQPLHWVVTMLFMLVAGGACLLHDRRHRLSQG